MTAPPLPVPRRRRARPLPLILLIVVTVATCAALYPLLQDWVATLMTVAILLVTAISILRPRHPG